MPQTTLVASSCAITAPPAATMLFGALQAVRAHAGEDQAEHPLAPDRGGRGKHRIDRRLAEIDRRTVGERDHRDAVAARDLMCLPPGAT